MYFVQPLRLPSLLGVFALTSASSLRLLPTFAVFALMLFAV
jgi:hypothetical protein